MLPAKEPCVLWFSADGARPGLVSAILASLRNLSGPGALSDHFSAFRTLCGAIKLVVMPVTKPLRQIGLSADSAELFRPMMFNVFGVIFEHLQISESVVQRVAVSVMDHFSRLKLPAEFFGHRESVLKNPATFVTVWVRWFMDKFVFIPLLSGHRYTVINQRGSNCH